ncbi:unnamed protein product, partial [Cladocopium goreaui]
QLSNSASLSFSLPPMASRWPEVAAFLFLDCREVFHSLLEDPLDWRALQCACRWRSSSLQPLLAKVHHEPKLRVVIKDMCQKLRRLPLDDLLGDQIRTANLTDTELRFLIEILGARPRGLSAKRLDLRGCFPSLCASQGFAFGLWLRWFQGESLLLAECRGLLRGLGELLRGLGSCELRLQHLDLCAAQLSKLEAPTLCRFLRSCQLETLNLAFNERLMSCEALEGMVDALQGESCGVSELVLKHCNIQGKAGELLGIWLRHMPRLRELNLNWNPEIVSSRGLRGLFNSLASDELALQSLRLRGSDPDQAAQEALRDVLQRFPSLTLELEVLPELLATHGPKEKQPRPGKEIRHAFSLLRLMRLPDFREQLRTFLPGPLEWRALQSSWRWSSDGSAGPLQEVHRRPRLRQSVSKLRRRLKGKPLNDLLSLVKCSEEEVRFAIELMGARPRKAPAGKVSEIRKLDLSYEHLPPGGKAMAPQQGMALGAFLRYCSQLVELRLEGNAQLCTAGGLRGLLDGLGEQRLQLRTLLFGGCGVAEQAAPYLGLALDVQSSRLLQKCPVLTTLNLAGNRNLCTAAGLRALLQSWAGDRIPLKQLVLKNCGLETSSAHVLGEVLRRCHYLEDLVLVGNQALFEAPALILLLKGLGDEGFMWLSNLNFGNLFEIDVATQE